jgi:signal transduction histidine kinase
MTLLHGQPATDQRTASEEELQTLLQRSHADAQRLSAHVCLLERRLRLRANTGDLLLIVHTIRLASEDLQTVFEAAVRTLVPRRADARSMTPTMSTPVCPEVVNLGAVFTRCVAVVRQRTQRRGIPLLCDIAPDLPSLTLDAEAVSQVFSVLLEHVVRASGKGGLEVRVGWTAGVLVIDLYDGGRGIASATYGTLRTLVSAWGGTLTVTQEFGLRSRVEIAFSSLPAAANGAGTPRPGGHR